MRRLVKLLAHAACAAACVPTLPNNDSLVRSTRILAVRADPAEAAPGARVVFTALVASPDGTASAAPVTWSFCMAPKPLTEDNIVSKACLDEASLVGAGQGASVAAVTPGNGCSLFGPDTASSGGFRPRDPDSTGGFYQPLRADIPGADTAFELARIHCDLPDADATAATEFAADYLLNQNPTLQALTATLDGAPVSLQAIPHGARLDLEVSWPDVSAETFAYFDVASQAVYGQRESMQVAWYVSSGELDTESTGRAADDAATTSDNGWTAADAAGPVHMWIVLRDSRGGVDFASYDGTVAP
jgi:hypothetical protein